MVADAIMTAVPADTKTLGIGVRLRAARERSGFTVIQAAERLHLDPKVIEAIEAEEFEFLGAPVYVRGHMRRYAELVGERGADLQEIYAGSLRAAAPPDLTQAPHAELAADPRRLLRPVAAAAGAAVLVAAVWWVLKGTSQPAPARAVDSDRPAVAEVVSVQPARPAESVEPASVVAPAAVQVSPRPAEDHVLAAPQTAQLQPERQVELRLTLNADSWVEIYDARGERLFYDVAAANSIQTVAGRGPLRVILGNAPGVAVAVNGQEVAIPPAARSDDAARFVVSSSGRVAQAR